MRSINFEEALPDQRNILILEAFLTGFFGKEDVGKVLVSQDQTHLVIVVPTPTEEEFLNKLTYNVDIEQLCSRIRYFIRK